jgi:hypothetical protein
MRAAPLGFAWTVALAVASIAAAAEEPRVQLPTGAYVRAGRPVVVRVPGGAERVRAVEGPWALPVGERGDEFVLAHPSVVGGELPLEVRVAGGSVELRVRVRPLPASGRVVGGFGEPGGEPQWVRLPTEGLPTVREAWLWLDEVRGEPPAADPAVAAALAAWRDGPRPADSGRAAFEPLTLPASEAAFHAAAAVERDAPALPGAAAVVLLVLAVTEGVLALTLVLRRERPAVRCAWLAVPPLAAAAWLLAAGRLPGALRCTAFAVDGPQDRLIVLRVEARRAGSASLALPGAAAGAAMLRYAPADASLREAQVGREVRLDLRAGEFRVLAYRLPGVAAAAARSDEPRAALERWAEGLGLVPRGVAPPPSPDALPTSAQVAVVPAVGVRVAPGK